MLIITDRHTKADLELWRELEEMDQVYYDTHKMTEKEARAIEEIVTFARAGSYYAGVSWGKDSLVVADLVMRSRYFVDRSPTSVHHRVKAHAVNLVWVRVEPIANPDCVLVRDAFTRARPQANYCEVTEWCEHDAAGWHATGTLERGFAKVQHQFGGRYLSGIRAEESGIRRMSRLLHGIATEKTCRPIIDWSTEDVFAYLAHYKLPVHPSYAMTGGGRWPREHLRVASLGGKRGDQFGRTLWENEYYPDAMARLDARPRP